MTPIQGMFIDYVYIFSDNTVKYKLIDAKRTFKNLDHFKEEYEKHYKIIELMNVNSSLISDLRFYKGSK